MSRSKKRDKDEFEDLKRIIKERESTIINLEKQIKFLKKQNKKKPEKKTSEEDVKACPTCKKQGIKYTQLGIKTLIVCSHCNFRATVNNLYG